jgi:AraC family transcriptional activator of pobA
LFDIVAIIQTSGTDDNGRSEPFVVLFVNHQPAMQCPTTLSIGSTRVIPHYFLYEESSHECDASFLHIEPIVVRSSRHDWIIRTHTHPDHHQILLLSKGGGTIEVEDEAWSLTPGTLIIVPGMTVHGFRFKRGTNGHVITVSTSYLRSILRDDPDLLSALARPARFLPQHLGDSIDLHKVFAALEREFVWAAPGRSAAIRAYLHLIAVTVGRLHGKRDQPTRSGAKGVDLVLRFRELIESSYRDRLPLETLARKLGVTTARLNACCRSATGKSSLELINDRVLVEAKRKLLYSGHNVAEIAASLGFSDPAYFNRFFAKGAGTSPGAFRKEALGTPKKRSLAI